MHVTKIKFISNFKIKFFAGFVNSSSSSSQLHRYGPGFLLYATFNRWMRVQNNDTHIVDTIYNIVSRYFNNGIYNTFRGWTEHNNRFPLLWRNDWNDQIESYELSLGDAFCLMILWHYKWSVRA